jgi:hypothetical protein
MEGFSGPGAIVHPAASYNWNLGTWDSPSPAYNPTATKRRKKAPAKLLLFGRVLLVQHVHRQEWTRALWPQLAVSPVHCDSRASFWRTAITKEDQWHNGIARHCEAGMKQWRTRGHGRRGWPRVCLVLDPGLRTGPHGSTWSPEPVKIQTGPRASQKPDAAGLKAFYKVLVISLGIG